MFEIEIRRTFSAAHQLRGYEGNCRNLHGHNYAVAATVCGAELNEIGIAFDFRKLKAAVDEIIGAYDHRNLSELPEFNRINPTSEVLARSIYRQLAEKTGGENIRVRRVRVEESENSAVTYSEE